MSCRFGPDSYIGGGGSGGSTSPGGSDTQIQFNDNGSFAGSADFTMEADQVTIKRQLHLDSGIAYHGEAKTSDYTLTEDDHIIGVDTSSGNVTITVPDATGIDGNHFWQVVKVTGDDNVVTLALAVPSQAFGSYDTLRLRQKGEGAEVKCYAAADSYWYTDISANSEFLPPAVETLHPSLSGTTLTLYGRLTDLGNNSTVDVYFRYRQVGASAWTETTAANKTSIGTFSDTATVTAGQDYEVQAIVETTDGDIETGGILLAGDEYYSGIDAAISDGVVRYWDLEETSGTDTAGEEAVAGDTLNFTGGATIGSAVINGKTRYHRILGTNDYGSATYRLPSGHDLTIMVQVQADLSSGDHTIFSNGRNRLSLASDNASIQLEVNGSLAVWSSATPFNAVKTLFVVVDTSTGATTLWDLSSGTAVNRASRSSVPNNTGEWFRAGLGAPGDSNHQDNEFMGTDATPGLVRSICIWERALSTSEMEDIADHLDNEGGLIVAGSGGSVAGAVGEVNVGQSLGGGEDIYIGKAGVNLQFRTLDSDQFSESSNLLSLNYYNVDTGDVAITTNLSVDGQLGVYKVADDANANEFVIEKIRGSSTAGQNNDLIAHLKFQSHNDAVEDIEFARIEAEANWVADGSEYGVMRHKIMRAGSFVSVMEVGPSGVGIGTSAGWSKLFYVYQSTSNDEVAGFTRTLGSTVPGEIRFHRIRGTAAGQDDDYLFQFIFSGRNDAPEDVDYAQILTQIKDATDGSEDGAFFIKTMKDGTMTTGFSVVGDDVTVEKNLIQKAMTAPGNPPSDSVARFTTASGTSPNRTITHQIKFEDGSVAIEATTVV